MPYYAQITSSICTAVTETAGPVDAPDMIERPTFDTYLIGWEWNGVNFISPTYPAAARNISKGAFFDRFGDAKWGILADTTPSVQAVVKDASVRDFIWLDNPQLPAGLAIISAAGHSIDASAIINNPILPGERP